MIEKDPNTNRAPKTTLRFLEWFCPEHLYEEIEGDLIQKFQRDAKTFGEKKAKRRFVWNVVRFFRPEILFRNKFSIRQNEFPMLNNYFKTSYRQILKNKINFIFKLSSLTVALLSFLVIAIYISYQLSFDQFHEDYKDIYRVNSERKENGKQEKYAIVPEALGAMIQIGFPEIKSSARIQSVNDRLIRYNQNAVDCYGIFATDSTVFDVFTFKFLSGNKDALKRPRSVVLTKSLASKIFGAEDPLHRLISITRADSLFEVTAVIEDVPSNSHLQIEALIPFDFKIEEVSMANIISPVGFVDHSSSLYIKFNSQASTTTLLFKIDKTLDKHLNKKERKSNGFNISLQPLKDIYLDPSLNYEWNKKGSSLYIYIFCLLAIFLLFIASINYVNLSIVGFHNRAKEIGVRKVLGARKNQIAFQVMIESIFYCLTALVLSLGLLYVVFPQVLQEFDPNLRLELLTEPKVIISLAFAFFALISFSTALPAYLLAVSNPINDIKQTQGIGRNFSFSKVLLLTQFVISIVCITATLIVGQQIKFIHTMDLGFNRNNLIVLMMPEDLPLQKMSIIKSELASIPGVHSISNSSFRIGGSYWKDWYNVEIDGALKPMELYEVFSDHALFTTLGMHLVAGRTFDVNKPFDDYTAFIINETAMRQFGWKDAIGKRINTHPEEAKWGGTVVGVVKDINISSLHRKVEPLVMRLPWQNNYPEYFVYVRISGSYNATVNAIKAKYQEIMPGYPISFESVDERVKNLYKEENKVFNSLQYGTLVIVLISSLGIFSLSLYMSIKRMKEFGIRKILGASVKQIAILHAGHFIKIVLVANVIAIPVSYWLMNEWLSEFAYRTEPGSIIFLIVTIISILLVIVSSAYSSWRTSKINPLDVIKIQ